MSDNMFRWEKDGDNVVTLTMDDPGGSANTLNDTFIHDLEKTLHRLEQEKDDIAGVVLTSAKKTFFAGADLNMIIQATPADAERLEKEIARVKAAFDPVGLLNPGKAIPTLNRCAEYGRMKVSKGHVPYPDIPRF